MGTFITALVVLELFCGLHLSYVYSFTDGHDRLYDLNSFGYDNVYPLRRYNSIDPYRFVGLGHSGIYNSRGSDFNNLRANDGNSYSNLGIFGSSDYGNLGIFGGSGYSNLGTNGGTHGSVYNTLYGGSGYSNLGKYGGSVGSFYNTLYGGSGHGNLGTYGGSGGSVYNTLYGGSGHGNLGTYGSSVYNTLFGGSGYSNLGAYGNRVYNNLYGGSGGVSGYNSLLTYLSDNSRLGQYQFGGYNSLYDIDDFGLGDSLLRYSSLGSSPPRSTDNLESHNYIGGNSNLEPDLYGGHNTGNDVRSIYTPSSFLRADTYSPEVYYVGNQNVRKRPRNRSSYK